MCILLSRGLVRRTLRFSRITRGRSTWHKTQCSRRTRSTSTCDPRFCGSLFFFGELFGYSSLSFEQCNIPPLHVLHISSCTEEGGCFSPCSVQSTIKSSVCSCLRFRILMWSLFFLVQLVGPVLGTSTSRKSGTIGDYLS